MADPISGAAAGLFILKGKTRKQAIRNRMLKLWKDRTKDPTSQWNKVKKSLGDIGLEAAALKEAQRIWKLHQKDLIRSGSVRDDRKTFDKSADQIYIVKPNTEVKLDRWGNYSGKSGYWQELPIQPDGSRMTQLQFHRTFPQYFPTKKSEANRKKISEIDAARKKLNLPKVDVGSDEQGKIEDFGGYELSRADAGKILSGEGVVTEFEGNIQKNLTEQKPSPSLEVSQLQKDWIDNTRNSPAANAGFEGPERWKLHIADQKWRKDTGRKYNKALDSLLIDK